MNANGERKVIALPVQEQQIRLHRVETTEEDMTQRMHQFFAILENAARRIQLEKQEKGEEH